MIVLTLLYAKRLMRLLEWLLNIPPMYSYVYVQNGCAMGALMPK